MLSNKKSLSGKKLLVLGGKPIGSCEIVTFAKQLGIYVIVADYLDPEWSPAKQLADEAWNVSTADIDQLEQLALQNQINGVTAGVHEFNLEKSIELSNRLGLPAYCNKDQWNLCVRKSLFKQTCRNYNIPVTNEYHVEISDPNRLKNIDFPVIVKPDDNCGSLGFALCRTPDELIANYKNALSYSQNKHVLIEKYMPFDSVIIHYTLSHGEIFFSGMSDKYSCSFASNGASVMGIQLFPSKDIQRYQDTLDQNVQTMFKGIGLHDGAIWIEAFNDHGRFTFNEMGYRFGGSLTYYPVQYYYGIDQLKNQILYSILGVSNNSVNETLPEDQHSLRKQYCILPLHVRAGKIADVRGLDEIKSMSEVHAVVLVHYKGETIENWGSAQQVFSYLHITYDTEKGLKETVHRILKILSVTNENGENLLYSLFNVETLQ